MSDGSGQEAAQPIPEGRRRRSRQVPGDIHHSPLVVRGAHLSPNHSGAKAFDLPRIKPRPGVVVLVLVAAARAELAKSKTA
jgi:hypothetical protein